MSALAFWYASAIRSVIMVLMVILVILFPGMVSLSIQIFGRF